MQFIKIIVIVFWPKFVFNEYGSDRDACRFAEGKRGLVVAQRYIKRTPKEKKLCEKERAEETFFYFRPQTDCEKSGAMEYVQVQCSKTAYELKEVK